MDEPRSAASLSREQLYELVWTTPILHLARQFGFSNVWLAKVCKKHDIPRPPRGYWAKKEFGKAPGRTPLPPQPDQPPITVEKRALSPTAVNIADIPQYGGELQEVYLKARALPPIVVRPDGELHPLLSEHRKDSLSKCIWVSKEDVPRALRIMDALFRAVEAVGGKVTIEGEPDNRPWAPIETVIWFAGDKANSIRLRESYSAKNTQPSWTEPGETRKVLMLDNGPHWSSSKFRWSDSPTKRLEDRLNRILLRLVGFAGAAKAMRLEREERGRVEAERRAREEEIAQRKRELNARQDEERGRVNGLLEEMECWQRSRRLREYIGVVQEELEQQFGGPIPEDSDQGRWLRWAESQADRLDPLVESPPSVLDERL